MNHLLKKAIPFSRAIQAIVGLNISVCLFHLLVLLQVVPYTIVWAGRLKTLQEMYVFETVSILINLLLIFTVLAKKRAVRVNGSQKLIHAVLWLFVLVFTLNTLGNLTAKASLEMYVATPLTFVLTILCWRVAIEKGDTSKSLQGPVQQAT